MHSGLGPCASIKTIQTCPQTNLTETVTRWKFCLEAIAEKQDGSRVWGEHGCHGDLSGLGSCSKLLLFVTMVGSGKP